MSVYDYQLNLSLSNSNVIVISVESMPGTHNINVHICKLLACIRFQILLKRSRGGINMISYDYNLGVSFYAKFRKKLEVVERILLKLHTFID